MATLERYPLSQDNPSIQDEELLGDVELRGEPYGPRRKLRKPEDRVRGDEEFFPLTSQSGRHHREVGQPRSRYSLGERLLLAWDGILLDPSKAFKPSKAVTLHLLLGYVPNRPALLAKIP